MYKVFVNNRVIFLVENWEDVAFGSDTHMELQYDGAESMKHAVNSFLKEPLLHRLSIIHSDSGELLEVLKSLFPLVPAAGGVVLRSPDHALLMIYRHGKWDLPKGKWEEGEDMESCAVREVQEECGIGDLTVNKKLPETYHMYLLNDGFVLKETHWYEMSTSQSGEFTPQTEEGIKKVEWKSGSSLKKAADETYESLRDLIGLYL